MARSTETAREMIERALREREDAGRQNMRAVDDDDQLVAIRIAARIVDRFCGRDRCRLDESILEFRTERRTSASSSGDLEP